MAVKGDLWFMNMQKAKITRTHSRLTEEKQSDKIVSFFDRIIGLVEMKYIKDLRIQ